MDTMRRMLEAAELSGNPSMRIRVVTVEKMLADYDDRGAMLTAFRHAANSIGVEAGITKDHVGHGEIAESVCGDVYYLELISEAEERFKRLSVKYEKLRAVAVPVLSDMEYLLSHQTRSTEDGSVDIDGQNAHDLREALSNG
jgi:hypothetical protein